MRDGLKTKQKFPQSLCKPDAVQFINLLTGQIQSRQIICKTIPTNEENIIHYNLCLDAFRMFHF